MPRIDVQRACGDAGPEDALIERWVAAVLASDALGDDAPAATDTELSLRIVDAAEGQALNARWRGRDAPTNVLSFPAELPPEVDLPLLGDLVLCAPVVAREAREQGKAEVDHWAHLVIHGVLHLLGMDHQAPDEAERMEALEQRILADLGIDDPYRVRVDGPAD